MSKQAIIDFLNELSEDPELRDDFREDPDSALEGRDITSEEAEMLKSGDADRIRGFLGSAQPPGFAKFNFGFAKKHKQG